MTPSPATLAAAVPRNRYTDPAALAALPLRVDDPLEAWCELLRGFTPPTIVHLDNARYHGGPRASWPTLVAWHATAGSSVESSVEWLNRPNAPRKERASYGHLIAKSGRLVRMTPVDVVAYHAGASAYPVGPLGVLPGQSINGRSLGVAFDCLDTPADPLTGAQLLVGAWYGLAMSRRFGIPAAGHVGHYEVAPGRKTDPRPVLDMRRWRALLGALLAAGVGPTA